MPRSRQMRMVTRATVDLLIKIQGKQEDHVPNLYTMFLLEIEE
jgi:hypothetical protein